MVHLGKNLRIESGIVFVLCFGVGILLGALSPFQAPAYAQTVQEFHGPMRLAPISKHSMVVTDHQRGMVAIVRYRDMAIHHAFFPNGRPMGVAHYKGFLFIGNERAQRVQVYDKDGVWQYNLGGDEDLVYQPTDIAIDEESGSVFVVDVPEKVVKVFDVGGAYLGTIPDNYPDLWQLANPTGIAVDPVRREVYVSDYGDPSLYIRARIQIFSYDGALIKSISGKAGMLGNIFSRPQGLALDGNGNIFLVDCFSGEVIILNRDTGKKIGVISGFGTDPGQLRLPLDVMIEEQSKDLIVTNSRSARIEVFEKGGIAP